MPRLIQGNQVNLLIPNLGSTSLKYQILEMPSETVLAKGRLERVTNYREAIAQISTGATEIDAVALKAVHAGPKYRGTFVVDDEVTAALVQFLPAAPAHNAIYLAAIEAFQHAMPGVPIVAAFEPEFHATMPEYARRYGVPGSWLEDGVVKYGFHGASHRYIGERVAAMLGGQVKLVSCHLGGSSSMCAIAGGRSVDTTMGFSPQSGLDNATRHGDLDVLAVLYMMDRHGWSAEEVRRQLAKEVLTDDSFLAISSIVERPSRLPCPHSRGHSFRILHFLCRTADPRVRRQMHRRGLDHGGHVLDRKSVV